MKVTGTSLGQKVSDAVDLTHDPTRARRTDDRKSSRAVSPRGRRSRSEATYSNPTFPATAGTSLRRSSWSAVDSDGQRSTHIAHSIVAKTTKAFGQCADRDTLNRVEVDGRTERDRILTSLEHNLTGNPPKIRRTWSNQRSPEPRDCCVTRQNDDGTTGHLRKFAPPDLSPRWQHRHEAAAASRKDANSPHSSGASIGSSS